MSLKKNIVANFLSQFYITSIGIVTIPLYIRYMGAEAYGLVGFFAMLQVLFMLLDMGLTPTLSRETACFRGGAADPLSYRHLVRALETIFLIVALFIFISLFVLSGYISRDWLQVANLNLKVVLLSLQLMAAAIGIRWMCGPYRGVISGSEDMVWLGGYNAFVATVRFAGVLPILIFIDATPKTFFAYQAGVALLELAGLYLRAHRLLPKLQKGTIPPLAWAPLKKVLRFSLTIAFASSVWVLVTQTDKLVLSKILPLAEYGYFSLAVLVAGGVTAASIPISTAILPRMATLAAEGDHTGLIHVYRQTTQLIAVLAGAVAIGIAFCAEPLLWAWTGDKILALHTAPILILYALGNGILAVAAFPYYLQYAKGDLRLHLIGNAAFVVILVPAIIEAASLYGAMGAGFVWLGLNLITFIFWLPFIHQKFEPGLNLKWYFQDILPIFSASTIAGFILKFIFPQFSDRWSQFGSIILYGILVLLAGALASSECRRWLKSRGNH